ncbi:hypothetical protein FOA52_016286 [Chlamydomonas sp. UWO 241]|nr:hypothetical protein FOA52_016286 [Chlamydomonas sp. UWO 241]
MERLRQEGEENGTESEGRPLGAEEERQQRSSSHYIGVSAKRNFPGEVISEAPVTRGEERRERKTSRYIGVCLHKPNSMWVATLKEKKRTQCIGYFASEEDAARAFDYAVVQARGPGAKRNFPGETISRLPMTVGEGLKSSRYLGVCHTKSYWVVNVRDPQTKQARHVGTYSSEEDAARAYDCAAVEAHGPGVKRNFPGEVISELPATRAEVRKQGAHSRFIGVTWNKSKSVWQTYMWDPLTKRERQVGRFTSEEDAARAYDCAAVLAEGPGAKRNFPGEVISEAPVTVGESRKQRTGSSFIGVSWHKLKSMWRVRLWDPIAKRERNMGCFDSEEDAARAYDRMAVQLRGSGVKRNFPGEAICEVAEGKERKRSSSSQYVGVLWHKANSVWTAGLYDPQAKRVQYLGSYASEEDAARAHDYAAVQAHGPGAKRNFPGEAISQPPSSKGEAREQGRSSRYDGVGWSTSRASWEASLYDPVAKRSRPIGGFASEEDAARAYDCAAVLAEGPGAKRNFPGEVISEPPATLGESRKQRKSSRNVGVCWDKATAPGGSHSESDEATGQQEQEEGGDAQHGAGTSAARAGAKKRRRAAAAHAAPAVPAALAAHAGDTVPAAAKRRGWPKGSRNRTAEERRAAADAEGERCEVCDSAVCVRPSAMLLCDGGGCGAGYHMSCLTPALTSVPKGDWFCPSCALISTAANRR